MTNTNTNSNIKLRQLLLQNIQRTKLAMTKQLTKSEQQLIIQLVFYQQYPDLNIIPKLKQQIKNLNAQDKDKIYEATYYLIITSFDQQKGSIILKNIQNLFKKDFITNIKDASLFTAKIAGGTAVIDAGSGVLISLAGFTTNGVVTGTIAAGVQSMIGAVQAGSAFAYLQSVGALGYGVLGATFAPVILGTVVVGSSTYMIYQYRQNILQAPSQIKNKITESKLDQKLKQNVEQIKRTHNNSRIEQYNGLALPKYKLNFD